MRLIDADELKNTFNVSFGGVSHAAIAGRLIDEAKTVDAAQIVRCKKCKWYADNNKGQWYGCWLFQTILGNEKERPGPEDYCSLGEAK